MSKPPMRDSIKKAYDKCTDKWGVVIDSGITVKMLNPQKSVSPRKGY